MNKLKWMLIYARFLRATWYNMLRNASQVCDKTIKILSLINTKQIELTDLELNKPLLPIHNLNKVAI